MKIITTREFRNGAKAFFELAEKESVVVKRGKKYVSLLVTEDPEARFFSEQWLKEFLAIPDEYRCNPFDFSPSGDLYWADKRNIDGLQNLVIDTKQDDSLKINTPEELDSFLSAL
jgi:hypothetical protein